MPASPLREVLSDATRVEETEFAQPALFAFGYALAELWRSWGVQPAAMLGHSVGEYVAATQAGVFSLEDGLTLIAARGRLMQACPAGAMLACFASAEQVRPTLERWPAGQPRGGQRAAPVRPRGRRRRGRRRGAGVGRRRASTRGRCG